MLYDLYQNGRIRQAQLDAEGAQRAATSAKSTTSNLENEIERLTERVETLGLLTMALWETLQAKFDISEEDLKAKILEIDLRDGKADGRYVPSPSPCPACGRTLSRRFSKCLYCGATPEAASPFRNA